ncbi:MAG: hypothetical protein A2782_01330 [Candidatus Blackburnbacteria bacterium RIFCSPHIGHO2_01_FULL_43_15b]|uniref:Uncharacterized protein n=1 Tax=Candidatus Blackburnbacteria bacterium RIFCSPHIGHO2_01_FULL_43_15b TaxID=1797513 RepID=A0A1G1UZ43_9BACT|nr:MAG: hypothetical protein A2782_01330 [Candidatus Blackburnbacteria bacterium RIFCSPHIGHO2_01_FULL_43_15b]
MGKYRWIDVVSSFFGGNMEERRLSDDQVRRVAERIFGFGQDPLPPDEQDQQHKPADQREFGDGKVLIGRDASSVFVAGDPRMSAALYTNRPVDLHK